MSDEMKPYDLVRVTDTCYTTADGKYVTIQSEDKWLVFNKEGFQFGSADSLEECLEKFPRFYAVLELFDILESESKKTLN